MKNIFFILISLFIFSGCGNQNKSMGESSGDSKVTKSDKPEETDTTKVNVFQLPKFKLAFERDRGVNIINSDLTDERYLYTGHDNQISPTGSELVYTLDFQGGSRKIALFEIKTKTSRTLNSVNAKQNFDATFSPDGKKLIFCSFSGKKWDIALINTDDSGYKILSDKYPTDLFCPTFAPDGNSILCQDMQNFVEIDFTGKIIKKIPLKEVIGERKIYFSSANRPFYINYKKEILFDADTEDFFETSREPISNIYLYNIETKTLKDICDKRISSYDPFPLSDGKHILFSAYTKEDLAKSQDPRDLEPVITSWIYIMNTDGSSKTKMIRNAYEPSASSVAE